MCLKVRLFLSAASKILIVKRKIQLYNKTNFILAQLIKNHLYQSHSNAWLQITNSIKGLPNRAMNYVQYVVTGEDGILEIHDINQESMNGQKNNSE